MKRDHRSKPVMINDALCTLYIYSVFVQVQDICTSIHTDDLDQRLCTAPNPYLQRTVEALKRGSSTSDDDVTT